MSALLLEGRGRSEAPRKSVEIPSGKFNPVVFIPGLGEADAALRPAMAILRRHGVKSTSHVGLNTGWLMRNLPPIIDHVDRLVQKYQEKVTLVGRSLGGVYADVIARQHPEWVKGLVKVGSPSSQHPTRSIDRTLGAGFAIYLHLQGAQAFQDLLDQPLDPNIPEHHIYSPDDKVVVDHQAHCQQTSATDHKVRGGHITMMVNPLVIRKLAQILPQS